MRGRKTVLIGLVILLAVIAWAWIDGGRRPVREIAIPLPVPAAVPASGPEGAR